MQAVRSVTVRAAKHGKVGLKKTFPCRSVHTTPVLPATQKDNDPLRNPKFKGKRRSGVNFDTLGSWNNRLDLPLNIDQSIKFGAPVPQISTSLAGEASLIGRRKENEDRYHVAEIDSNVLMFAIYDGHAGAVAVEYTKERMEEHIRFWLSKEHDLHRVLFHSFVDLNNAFTRYLNYKHMGDEQAMNSGTTATVCLIRNCLELVVANVGDSSALLCRDGKAIKLSKDHKPNIKDEKERIRRFGGDVTMSSHGHPKVNGRLDMTRSIGDVELKAYGVIAEPTIRSIAVKHGQDAFLALLTDGVTFVMNDQEIVNIISTHDTAKNAANFITDQALQYGSDDNVTALVVPFGAWGKYSMSPNVVPYSFGRNIVGGRYS